MTRMTRLEYAVGKAAEKPLVNPKRGRHAQNSPDSGPAAPRGGVSAPPVAPQHAGNGLAPSPAPAGEVPSYRLDKTAIMAYLPTGYRTILRRYQAQFDAPPGLREVLMEALDDFFVKKEMPPVVIAPPTDAE